MNEHSKIQKVRAILLRDWDPFCIGDNPHLVDEYDSFIPGIVRLIENNSSFDKLNRRLIQIEEESHAPISDKERTKTVKALQNIVWE